MRTSMGRFGFILFVIGLTGIATNDGGIGGAILMMVVGSTLFIGYD